MPCQPPKSNADKLWSLYEEYYHGERDDENRKHGNGLHRWTGARSLEWYKGRLLRDTMHGYGDYRWRYLGPNHTAITYEGRFYNNRMHGYGVMSYPDGRVYTGLFYNNVRWGPGVVSHACNREDVGLWNGTQLVRLAWRPAAPSVTIDFASVPVGRSTIAPHRVLLTSNTRTIGEVNSALELLKQYGSEPLAAINKWTKLYPKSCTDTDSQLCHVEVFDRAYHDKHINTLNEISEVPDKNASQGGMTYYAWNNNEMIIHMMKHCYKHEKQRMGTGINLTDILSGSRTSFQSAGKHELHCRTLLMASYLGHISNVAQLVNENDVDSNVTDIQGNSALMYATCGDQPEIIHFLKEAGAEVDGYNDACCTPLGIALLRFALARWEIDPSGMVQALLPAAQGPALSPLSPTEETVFEWNIKRELVGPLPTQNVLQRSSSKVLKPLPPKKIVSQKDLSASTSKRKSDVGIKEDEIDHTNSEEKQLYNNITNEYFVKVCDDFSSLSKVNNVPYIFEVYDMSRDVDFNDDDRKKLLDKNPKKAVSRIIKDTIRTSRDMMWQSASKEDNLISSKEQMKQDKLNRIILTILQLLSEGADPRKVRCPQPPLFIATVAGSSDLVHHLVSHGADINEVYPKALGYTTLDVAVSGPLTVDNLEVIRSLLQNGARTDHKLPEKSPTVTPIGSVGIPVEDGPTLLHAVLGKHVEFEHEEEIRRQVLQLLLQYGCNPVARCMGRSAIDVAMSKNLDILDIFIKSPQTDLNAVINDSNQSILLKMFYLPFCKPIPLTERLQTLTNLLLFGADPLIKCQNGKEEYDNLFVYARKVLTDLEASRRVPSPLGNPKKSKSEIKGKKPSEKSKKDEKLAVKSGVSKNFAKAGADDYRDYEQALDLVVECARLLYIRWLQAKLMKELIVIVDKYKHRQWNMIIKEHNHKKCTGLWLTAVRSLEIWDTLKTTKKRIYNDDKVLKFVLCIVHYYYKMTRKILKSRTISAQQKAVIESEVAIFIREHKLATMSTPEMVPAIRQYVTPELTVKGLEKFNVCFECAMPLIDPNIQCLSCKLIAFCSFDCMKINIERINCHPCSGFLKEKYFSNPPTIEETETDIN